MGTILNSIVALTILVLIFRTYYITKSLSVIDDGYKLKYSASAKRIGIGLPFLMFILITYAAFTIPIENNEDIVSLIGLYLFTTLFAVYFYIEFFTVEIVLSKNGIEGTSGWRGKRFYSWTDISEITYSPMSMWFKITSPNKIPLRIHAGIDGIDIFSKYFIENLHEDKWLSAYKSYNQSKSQQRNSTRTR